MTRARSALALVGAAMLTACAPEASPPSAACEGVPALAMTGRLTDAGAMLDATAAARVQQALAAYEAQTGRQMVVATVASLGGVPVENYAKCLGNRWGVGHAQRDDGVVILLARDDRRVRIATGRGAEAMLTNAEAAAVIGTMTTAFRQGDLERGLLTSITQIGQEMGGAASGEVS